MFNPWLYSIRMGNVRNFLATKKDGVFNSGMFFYFIRKNFVESCGRGRGVGNADGVERKEEGELKPC